ncbi:glycosyltransferase sugar-binding region DXD motif-containing protein-domain-containing protein [Talaromyces proteolyticus]|uniref:Glycosyltransferase sugar-binding region DXD motif-containing protein-domain-containing protein n=1 Tax=Talaromyces proteolyticus TaxID=1131652 RepID=A0AAD4KH74_9EURO|nr:glycosyltransferase sugar-binding region DXD motif-containing protein-domain-containing protein [Talaromyces proteolyticus]KAH8691630.1 glycosyltransferase sugar-binding region DXD motif-containing protein-domain-containing protein [Talaromyces proteolyticus]
MKLRIRPLFIILPLFILHYFIITRIANFAQIFSTKPYAGIPLSQSAIKDAYYNGTAKDQKPEAVIPQRIHQIYHDWSGNGMPHSAQWGRLRASCIDRHPGWIYKLWSASESREFLLREYPWFLPVYDSYRYPVQRVDAMKYFVLRHYGGIYIDLDNGCLESLEPLRYYPVFTTDNNQGPLLNNILGSMPQHPYYQLLTDSLPSFNWLYWPFPYLTIQYASGGWFQTAIWEKYHRQNHYHNTDQPQDENGPLYRVIMDSRRGAEPWVFWNEGAGQTWENWDNSVFLWIGEHIYTVVRIVAAVSIVLVALIAALVWKCCLRGRKEGMKTKAGLKTAVSLISPQLTQSEDIFAKKHDAV